MKIRIKIINAFGLFIFIFSIIRWGGMFYYDDLSQMGFGCAIGVIILLFAYIYNWMILKDLKERNDDKRFDNIIIQLRAKDIITMELPIE